MNESTPEPTPSSPTQARQPSLPAYRPPSQPVESPNTPAAPATAPLSPPAPAMSPYQTPSASPQMRQSTGDGVSALAIDILARTKKWVRLCSIMGFLFAALLIIGGIFVTVGTSAMSSSISGSQNASFRAGYSFGMVIGYAILAILYIYPSVKLWQYASSIARLMQSSDPIDLETALDKQRSFWKFTGVIILLGIVFYGLIILLAIVGAAARTM